MSEIEAQFTTEQTQVLERFKTALQEWGESLEACALAGIAPDDAFAYVGLAVPPGMGPMFVEMFAQLASG